jgi:hypothetical protein
LPWYVHPKTGLIREQRRPMRKTVKQTAYGAALHLLGVIPCGPCTVGHVLRLAGRSHSCSWVESVLACENRFLFELL